MLSESLLIEELMLSAISRLIPLKQRSLLVLQRRNGAGKISWNLAMEELIEQSMAKLPNRTFCDYKNIQNWFSPVH